MRVACACLPKVVPAFDQKTLIFGRTRIRSSRRWTRSACWRCLYVPMVGALRFDLTSLLLRYRAGAAATRGNTGKSGRMSNVLSVGRTPVFEGLCFAYLDVTGIGQLRRVWKRKRAVCGASLVSSLF